jgi:hypothetical protein
VILDVIISSAWEVLSYFCPLVSVILMSLNDNFIFFWCPFTSFDVRVKMVMPSFSALLAYSPRKLA